MKEKCPSVFLNQLIMKDFPSLTHLDAKDGCFQDIGIISLENVNLLKSEDIKVGRLSFFSVYCLHDSSRNGRKSQR